MCWTVVINQNLPSGMGGCASQIPVNNKEKANCKSEISGQSAKAVFKGAPFSHILDQRQGERQAQPGYGESNRSLLGQPHNNRTAPAASNRIYLFGYPGAQGQQLFFSLLLSSSSRNYLHNAAVMSNPTGRKPTMQPEPQSLPERNRYRFATGPENKKKLSKPWPRGKGPPV